MELLIILLLTLVNGVFAMSEIAVVSSRKVRLQQMVEDGNTSAKTALDLTNNPNQFLSTVQIGITLIGILLGVFGGATIAETLADSLRGVEFLAASAEPLAVGLVTLLTGYLSLVLGELVPKRIAMQRPERIALLVAGPMSLLSRLTTPVVRLLSFSTEVVLRLLGTRESSDESVTEAEILGLVEQGISTGIFEESEHEMIEGVLRLDDLTVAGLMIPRVDMVWLDVDAPLDETRKTLIENAFDFYPVCQGSIDNPLGIVSSKALLSQALSGQALDIRAVMIEPVFLPENASASNVLGVFKSHQIHMALVVGEYGGIEGVITIDDVMAEIVGELDQENPEMVRREDGSWLLDGLLPVYHLEEIFEDFKLPEDESGEYHTVAGFLLFRMGRIPRAADSIMWGDLVFEVIDMDRHQIDKILVRRRDPESREDAETTQKS